MNLAPRKPVEKKIPAYCKHKHTGQAVVTLTSADGSTSRDIYLGKHGTPESQVKYARLIQEWTANGYEIPPSHDRTLLTVTSLIARYKRFVEENYPTRGGLSCTLTNVRDSVRFLHTLYGDHPAVTFGPANLRAVRESMIGSGLARSTINDRINRIRTMFRWAVSYQLLPETVYRALCAVEPLKKGRTKAREAPGVDPVEISVLRRTLPHLNKTVRALARLEYYTGMRPGEVVIMRVCDVQRHTRDGLWIYQPAHHKTEHLDQDREIVLGRRAQRILRRHWPLPGAPLNSPIFPTRRGQPWTVNGYAANIRETCDKYSLPRWHPNQLRHLRLTITRERFGLDHGQAQGGHKKLETTQVYAHRMAKFRREVARKAG